MRFLAANDLNNSDPMPTLGEKVERAAAPTPSRGLQKTGTKGVFQGPDGKFFTAIPENEVAGGALGRAKPLNGNSVTSKVTAEETYRNELKKSASRYQQEFDALSKRPQFAPGDRVVLLHTARKVSVPARSADGKTVHTVRAVEPSGNPERPEIIVVEDAHQAACWQVYPEDVWPAPPIATSGSLNEALKRIKEAVVIDSFFLGYAPRP